MPTDEEVLGALLQAMPTGEVAADELEDWLARGAEVLAEVATPDFEVAMVGSGAGFKNEFRGIAGFQEAWRDWMAPFSSITSDLEDVRRGESAYVALTMQRAVPKDIGTPIEQASAAVIFISDGLLRRIEFHLDQAAALRAAGAEPG